MSQPTEVVTLAIPYLRIVILWHHPPPWCSQTFRQFAEGMHKTHGHGDRHCPATCQHRAQLYTHLRQIRFPRDGFEQFPLIFWVIMGIWMMLCCILLQTFHGLAQASHLVTTRNSLTKMLHWFTGRNSSSNGAFGFSAGDDGLDRHHSVGCTPDRHQSRYHQLHDHQRTGRCSSCHVARMLGQRDIQTMRRVGFVHVIDAVCRIVSMSCAGRACCSLLASERCRCSTIQDRSRTAMAASRSWSLPGSSRWAMAYRVVCAGALRGLKDVKSSVVLIFVAYWVIAHAAGLWLAFHLRLWRQQESGSDYWLAWR